MMEGALKADPHIRLDILVKREKDYYLAHCLQFDLVTTDETIKGVQQGIIDACIAHIQFSHKNDNMDYLFSPAPQEAWSEYYVFLSDPNCSSESKQLKIPLKGKEKPSSLPAFMIQEILCLNQNQASCRT